MRNPDNPLQWNDLDSYECFNRRSKPPARVFLIATLSILAIISAALWAWSH